MEEERRVGLTVNILSNEIKRALDNNVARSLPQSCPATGMQGRILGFILHLSEMRDVYQRDVEAEFDIRRSTASQTLTLLEGRGLIRREPVPQDERMRKLVVTERGRLAHQTVERSIDSLEQELARGIAPADLRAFFRVADAITGNLRNLAVQSR